MTNNTNEHQDAISSWEDEGGGGAGLSDQRSEAIAPGKKGNSEQDRLDASHESDVRGEHRYLDAHQTGAEQTARRDRDDLKRRLAARLKPGAERKLRAK